MPSKFPPTAEQEKALELFLTGADLVIEAGAGTGKTATLVLISEAAPERKIQYVAFNRAIVKESADRFPGNVSCSTAHSLAFRAVGHDFQARLRNAKRIKSTELAKMLRLDPITVVNHLDEKKTLSGSFLAGIVMRGLTRFCQSADADVAAKHVPEIPNLDAPTTPEKPRNRHVNNEVAKALEPAMRRAWTDATRFDGALPYKHDYYLKLWQLSDPRIDADVVLFDEAQDANPVLLDIVRQQQGHAQVVWVGDSQQSIYGFTGAINALKGIREGGANVAYLTRSFRFGPAVAGVANGVLEQLRAELRLVGTDAIPSRVCEVASPDAILTRTNAQAVREVLAALGESKRPHLVGGGREIVDFARGARDLKEGRRTEHPELACFESWGEVQWYVENDEQGDELRLLVSLIDEFGVDRILEALEAAADERGANVVVSTAHKSKGREWGMVRLGGDFPPAEKIGDDERRLLYVAVTRAKLMLDVSMVPILGGNGASPSPASAPLTESRALPPAANSPRQERPASSRSEHVGRVGSVLDLVLRVTREPLARPSKYGGKMYVTELVDEDSNRFKWFGSFELETDVWYEGSWEVKGHEEYRGTKETVLTRPSGLEQVEEGEPLD